MRKVGRNDPCPCGSGKRSKHCCLQLDKSQAVAVQSDALPSISIHAALEHHQAGRMPQAKAIYQQILQAEPNHPEALHLLGVIAHQEGNYEIAVELISKAISVISSSPMSHLNLGLALQAQGKLDEAIESYQKALSIKPDYAEAHINLGSVHQAQGKLDEAIEHYHNGLSFKPSYAEAHYNLGTALQAQGKLDAAIESYHKALSLKPDYAEAHYTLGITFRDQGNLDAAIESCRMALSLKPDYAEAHNSMGNALRAQGKLAAAVESYRKALLLRPDFAEALNNLGNALLAQGKPGEAIGSYQKALSIKADFAMAHSNLLYLHGYHAFLDPHEYLSMARGWELAGLPAQDRQAAHNRNFYRPPLAGRRLRVGYVSGDFRQHAVSYFVEQLFAHHDRGRVELFAYSSNGQRDVVTERLQASVEHWVPLVGVSDAAARERIEVDGIDVLIDLSGHTSHNRLGVFARRAAPVQVHYLGFMASTGLTEMDYWIGDEILTPFETDSHFSEQVWRLPRVWVSYEGKEDASLPDWHSIQNGTVWLGSFNDLGKLTPATLALWAQVLHALPEARLLLKTKDLADNSNRQRILDVLASQGIVPDRIELQDRSITPDWTAHMAYYNRLDIALDPVGGVGGGTTTCDALWMGVPVITLKGDRMASRMTSSMLNAIGHQEWIACSEAEYVGKVVTLARDVAQRKALRLVQRNQMAHSPLCDAKSLVVHLENAYFEMFERWLERQDEQSSTVSQNIM